MSDIKIGISAKFHPRAPVFYGEAKRHIQYLETSIANWVAKNKGLPFMIPSESEASDIQNNHLDVFSYARELDALVLQGGVDVHPSLYGSKVDEGKVQSYDLIRDQYELKLIEAFLRAEKPILGICRGFQLLNVFFGGTLHHDLSLDRFSKHLDIETEEKHTHVVNVVEGNILSRFYKNAGHVVSMHHQGIDQIGQGLTIEAFSPEDNLIEAFSSLDKGLIIGVQWHPEFQADKKTDQLDAKHLFNFFLEAVKNRKHFGDARVKTKKRMKFSTSSSLTLGTELEVQLLDKDTSKLKPIAIDLLKKTEKETKKIKCEIFQSMIELETDICTNANEVEKDLIETVRILKANAKTFDAVLGSSGIHPFEKYTDRLLFPSSRYEKMVKSRQWIARRISIFGLHCHVGASSTEQGIELYRFYYSMAPILLALSSSSPFYQSDFTGLHSVRSTFFESIPSGGHPPLLDNWKQFEGLMSKMLNSGAILSHKDLWWDLRPSPNYGTIEIRICDSMPTISENVAIIAFIHLIGYVFLNSKNELFKWPDLSDWSYRENKWRAIRYGTDFQLILDEQGNSIHAPDYIKTLLDTLSDYVVELGYEKHMAMILKILEKGTASCRMIKQFEKTGDLKSVVELYVNEFETNLPEWE